jgi:hypothetical protein
LDRSARRKRKYRATKSQAARGFDDTKSGKAEAEERKVRLRDRMNEDIRQREIHQIEITPVSMPAMGQ